MSSLFSYDDFDTPRIATEAEKYRQSPNAVKDVGVRTLRGVANTTQKMVDSNRKKGTITGGLRATNSSMSQSRMSLPLSDVAKSGVQSIGTTAKSSQPAKTEPSDLDRLKGAYDIDYKYRGLYGNQDIDLSKRKIKEVNTLANNEANRALGMELATRLPYASLEQNLTSMRQAGVNAANMTNSISGAYNSSVSKLNPVSMSL